jgi:RNA polymerase sigma-70 factor, ECF subfamily
MIRQVTLSEAMLTAATQASGAETSVDATLATTVREHARMVFQIAYSVLRNHHDAEDASQEVFLRVWRYRGKLDEVADVKAWVARIAWRVAVERRPRTLVVSLDDQAFTAVRDSLQDDSSDAESQAAHHQMQAWLQVAIGELPQDLRDPLLLSTVQGMNAPEIAAVLNVNEGTVRTRLFRARERLKQMLTQSLEKAQ